MPGSPAVSRHAFADRVAAAAAAGYSGLCLHLRDYRAQRDAGHSDGEMREVLHRQGIADISLEFLTGWFLDGTAAAGSRADEATALAAARAFGAHSLNVGSDFQNRGFSRALMRTRFHELCDRAGAEGLAIALEIVPWSDVADIDTAVEMIDGIDNAGLVVDCWHVFRGGIPLGDLRRIPGDRILSIQVNDAAAAVQGTLAEDTMHRLPCGDGVFDLAGFVAALDDAGAAVPLSVEIISPAFAALDLDRACAVSAAGARRLLQDRPARTS
jgi:sugar phosphate isomerase/epimerase